MPTPTSIDSNVTGLAIAEETSLKVLPGTPIWFAMEPNNYSDFGATFNQVARETINATRQRLRGTITDEEAKGGFNIDFTQRNLTRLLQGFFWADAFEKPATQPLNGTQVPITSVSATQYLAAAGLGGFLVNSLVFAKNFIATANNGLKQISVVAAGALTVLGGGLTVDAAPDATAQLETVGYRCVAGDIDITISGANVLLLSTALDFTTLGLHVGEWLFVGGDAAINNFGSAPANNQGYARVGAIAAHTLTFDFTAFIPLNDTDIPATQKLDLYFGKMIQNAATAGLVKRRSYQLERQLGNDGVGGNPQSEYVVGAIANQLTLNVPQANKLNADMTFVGLDVEQRSSPTNIKAGTRVGLPGEAAINTSHDLYLSRLAIVDTTLLNPAALFAYASDVKLTVDNNAAAVKAIGVLGGFNVSSGDFAVSGTITAYFATVAAIQAIKNNAAVALQMIFARGNAGMVFDVPGLTLGGGGVKIEKDKPITVDLTQNAFKAPSGFTMAAIFFEYLPTVAMPI